jgi:putative flippase GtrA
VSTATSSKKGGLVGLWKSFEAKHPGVSQFLVFFMLSNGVTVLQMILLPALKWAFSYTALEATSFQALGVGTNLDGSPYFVFDYAAGALPAGGGGLAYFLAVQITLAIAQIINFFAQRNITFKSTSNIWRSAFWYLVAYIVISIGAAALQGLYKAPVYNLLMNTWALGAWGGTLADFITMFINSAISFWVFFPIFKVIFKNEAPAQAAQE